MKTAQKKCGYEKFSNGINLLQFWQWAHSDVLGNAERGKLAEFIVASALNCSNECRIEWDAYDLITLSKIKVEVKSSAYLQSWKQNSLSKIVFDVRPTRFWFEETNQYADEAKRQADVYVFCLFTCRDIEKADPLNLLQWEFFVIATSELDRTLKAQKTITLSSLLKLPVIRANFDDIATAVERAFSITPSSDL